MALFYECMQKCAQKVLDTADIVRDGDFSPNMQTSISHGRAEAPVQSRKSLRFLNNNFKAFIDLTPNMIATI